MPDVVRFRLRTKHVVIAITVFDGPFGPLTSCEPALNGTTDLVRRFGHCGVNYSEPLQRMLSSRRLHPKAVATELKGYNIAAEAFTDQRLKKKPYHLIFVGAPDGKQDEVRQNLLRCGIAEEQLTVRKFIKNRDRMKDLLCEADLAIMPSKSEGFGLVALEALSAGLPILVGSKSGFAKALENVPFGKSCIVYSDDPSKWAEAIEAVRARHRMRLKEIIALRASYKTMYCLKEQCEALVERMWRMVHGTVVFLHVIIIIITIIIILLLS